VRLRRAGILLLAVAGVAWPQAAISSAPTFDAASIKPSAPKSIRLADGGPGSSDPGLYRFGRVTLLDLIMQGYKVDRFQVSSKVSLENQEFDLVATVPRGATRAQLRVMLQNLLAERFHAKLHIESKEFPAYELVVAKSGLKLKEGAVGARRRPEDGCPDLPPNQPAIAAALGTTKDGSELVCIGAQQEPLSVLARMLRVPDHLPVVDKTGLSAKYDFTLQYTPDTPLASPDAPPELPSAPFIFTALEKQLGLELVRKKLPLDVVVVDSVDPMPTEN
jgi:uncharacterized protein (TIGR03435 family)